MFAERSLEGTYDNLLVESKVIEENLQSATLQEYQHAPATEAGNVIAESSVPAGWTLLEKEDGFCIKSPNGTSYSSRSDAFEDMILTQQYSYSEIMLMRECLKYEGWVESRDIPDGWMIQPMISSLMEQGGKVFQSVQDALDFVRAYGKYYSSDASEKLQNLLTNSRGKINCDQEAQRNHYNPEPVNIDTKENMESQLGYQEKDLSFHMKRTTPSKHQKSSRGHDESWKDAGDTYPLGWKVKQVHAGNGNGSFQVTYIRSSSGTILKSKTVALAFMIKNQFPDEDIRRLRRSLKEDGWISTPLLPDKWLYKRSKRNGSSKSNRIIYSNEEGARLPSKEYAIKLLSKEAEKYSHEISLLKEFTPPIETDNNSSDDQVSHQIEIVKEQDSSHQEDDSKWGNFSKVLDYSQQIIDSYDNSHYNGNIAISQDEKFRQKLEQLGHRAQVHENDVDFNDKQNNYNQQYITKQNVSADSSQNQHYIDNENFYHSQGTEFSQNSSREASQNLYYSQNIELSMNSEHYQDLDYSQNTQNISKSSLNPENDLNLEHSQNSSNHYESPAFISPANLEHGKKLNEQLKNKKYRTGQAINNSNVSVPSDPNKSWTNDEENLYPPGWKYRDTKDNRRWLLSPAGLQFNGVRIALEYMLSNNFPDTGISIMRKAMSKSDWNLHSNLPENWFYKKMKRNLYFCDASGRLRKTKEEALRALSERGASESDISKVQLFNHTMTTGV